MELLPTEQEQIQGVAERWKHQYFVLGKWAECRGNSWYIYKQLVTLSPTTTRADVAEIIGNDGWIGYKCGDCGQDGAVVSVGGLHGSDEVCLCRPCVVKLVALVAVEPPDLGCRVPPAGWWCSREPGHSGPCAARQKSAYGRYVAHVDDNELTDTRSPRTGMKL
jgi:hypothetical protein